VDKAADEEYYLRKHAKKQERNFVKMKRRAAA
jgi:hypothetical protein